MATGVENYDHIPEPSLKHLNTRQAHDYEAHLVDLKTWLEEQGANPEKSEGYAEDTVDNYLSRIDQFYRWSWAERKNGYTTRIDHDDADAFVNALAEDEYRTRSGDVYNESSKRKMTNAVEVLFKWRARTRGGEKWEPTINFSEGSTSPADEFTEEERSRLREAALTYDTIPAYGDLSPEERDRWKAYLAQRLGKKKSEVSLDDWEKVNRSWKIPSLIHVTLDAGLRPCEVKSAKVSWFRPEKGELFIPKEDSSKNRDHWHVTLLPKTVELLQRWLKQRESHTKYDDSDRIWLNRESNPYKSQSLNRILDNLCEEADIDQENRKIVWYSFRHSVGTHMANKGGLEQASEQLRHKSLETTRRYVRPSHEERRNTLNEIG